MTPFTACFIIVILSSTVNVFSQLMPTETFRYTPGDESPRKIIRNKLTNVKHTHSLLKGGIWDEIFPNMIYIPTATYLVSYQGSDSNNLDSKKRRVTVRGFYMLNTEVTNKMYRYFLADSSNEKYQPHYNTDNTIKNAELNKDFSTTVRGRKITLKNYAALDDYPVVGVSWQAAHAFNKWLRKKADRLVDYKNDRRLTISFLIPTEAQYTLAAIMNLVDENATSEELNNSLNEQLKNKGNARINYGSVVSQGGSVERKLDDDGYYFTNPVKKFAAGKIGLYGMQGNAAEWVADVFRLDPTRYSNLAPVYKDSVLSHSENRQIHNEYYRDVKGGSWYDGPFYMQPCIRQKYDEQKGSERIGFRIAILDLQQYSK